MQLERIKSNFKAIKASWEINKAGFPLTDERKKLLNDFSGWGGCNAMVLPLDKDWKKAGYSKEHIKAEKEVKKGYKYLCDVFGENKAKQIWEDIKTATLTSFYTPQEIPSTFFEELQKQNQDYDKPLEFLDPCAGSGVYIDSFLSCFPNSKVTAVEKDFLTSFLLTAKYKEQNNVIIYRRAFEEVNFGNKKFDVIASNIPFGDFKITYPQYNKVFTDKIHNFFFYHSQNLLKEKGIISFITSTGVFNSAENKPIRENLLKEGNITNFKVLPNNTFEHTAVASHLVTYIKDKEAKTAFDQSLFINTQVDENGVQLNEFVLNNKEQVYLSEPKLTKNQFGKAEYSSKHIDFELLISKLQGDWETSNISLQTEASVVDEKPELIAHNYPSIKVGDLKIGQTNLIEEIQFLRNKSISNNFYDFKIVASVKGRIDAEQFIPLVTFATVIDKVTRKKHYFFQSDLQNISFTDKEEKWVSSEAKGALQDIFENLTNISEDYQLPIQVDFRRDKDGRAFYDYFTKNYNPAHLDFAYTKNIDFNFHRAVQEGDVFVTKKGNIAQVVEVKEIVPDVDAEFPQKSESYKVKQIELHPNDREIIIKLLELYSTYNVMIKHHHQYLNGTEWSQQHLENNRDRLNQVYDDFVANYGQINITKNRKLLEEYKDLFKNYQYILTALENNVEEKIDSDLPLEGDNIRVTYQKAGIFNYDYEKEFNQELTTEVALIKSFSVYGRININYITKITKKEENVIIEELNKYAIFNPITKEYELKENFLKGDIYIKKEEIERLPDSTVKEEALTLISQYMPDWKPFHSIVYQMGSRWIPIEIYKEFIENHYDTKFNIAFNEESDQLYVKADYSTINRDKWHNKKMGNGRYFNTEDIIYNAFYNTTYYVRKTEKYKDEKGKEKSRSITLYEDTAECKRHIDNLRQHFMKYMLTISPEKQEKLTEIYNRKFNNTAKKNDIDYSFYKLGVNLENLKALGVKQEYDHQIEGSWQAVTNNGGIIDHEVGYGKTLTLIATAHNLKKYGKARLPLILGLPANVNELAKTYQLAYPEARILYAGKDFSGGKEEEFFNKMRNNEYDVVIMSHTQLEKIPISDEIYLSEAETEKRKVESNLETAILLNDETTASVNQIKRLQQKLIEIEQSIGVFKYNIETGKNKNIPCLENLGIDHIIIDESHKFKNRSFSTRHNQVKGIGNPEGSKRANILRYALRTIQRKNGSDYGATFFSGTPITNALAELYILQDYLTPRVLKNRGISNFDAWASTFIEKTTEIETNMVGNAVLTERFRKYMNMPELSEMYNSMTHTRRGDNEFVKRPIQDVQPIVNELTPLQKKFNAKLVKFLDSKGANEKSLKLEQPIKRDGVEVKALSLITTNLAWKSSLDMRLINSSYPDDPNSKVNHLIENVLDRYKRYNEGLGTQIIFCSESTSKEKLSYEQMKYNYENNIFTSMYDDIKYKLISRGIPEYEIAFVQDYKDDKSKAKLSKLMNEGKIRVLIGGIINAGTGLNIQKRLCGVTHLTLPWTPAELEQGNGRIHRAGNEIVKLMNNNRCEIRMCATKGTLDIYKSEFLSRKAKFINQLREGADNKDVLIVDEGDLGGEDMAMDMATLQAELAGDKTILEKAVVDKKLNELTQRISATEKNKAIIENKIQILKDEIKRIEKATESYKRDIEKTNQLIEYKGDKRVNKPIVVDLPELTELYNEEAFANYLKQKYEEVRKYNLGKVLKVGEMYGFDMMMCRNFEGVTCYIQSQEQPYTKYHYGADETINIKGSNTVIANYYSNCFGTMKNKYQNQEKGLVKIQEKLEETKRMLKNEVVTPEMYNEQKELREQQQELTAKLIASGGIRTKGNYEKQEIIIAGENKTVYRVTDDLNELERALLYDQFGQEGKTGYVYLKKDTYVYDLFVNQFNHNGIELKEDLVYNEELGEYFVSFDIKDVDALYVKFSEITNPQPVLPKVDLGLPITLIEKNIETEEFENSLEEEKQRLQTSEQLSLFEEVKEIEPMPTVFEETKEEVWQCPEKYKAFPMVYETDNIEAKDKEVHRIFYVPGTNFTWYLNELDKKTGEAYGLVAMHEVEWGYFSVKELLELGAVEVQIDYPKTYEQLLETELKNNLTKEELNKAFFGKLVFEKDLWEQLPDEDLNQAVQEEKENRTQQQKIDDTWQMDNDEEQQNNNKIKFK